MPPYRRVAIVLLWKYYHSHSFSRVNFQACALILPLCQQNVESAEQILSACAYELPLRPPQFRIRISNQGIYLMVTLFEMKTAMDANLLLPLLMLVLSLRGTSFTKCPPSEYSAPNGTHYYHTITCF